LRQHGPAQQPAHQEGVAPICAFEEREMIFGDYEADLNVVHTLRADGDLYAFNLDRTAVVACERLRRFAEKLIAHPKCEPHIAHVLI
jgi:hypothetical protein